jgi:acetolactate synthase-1/2/3 large subunit
VERLAYLAEFAQMQLDGIETLVLVDSTSPVSFFAYPGKPSDLVPPGCTVHVLATGTEDAPGALESLAELLEGDPTRSESALQIPELQRPSAPTGRITPQVVADAIGATLPEDAIVSDEANTSGIYLSGPTAGCPPHQWLTLTGGAIGQGMPVATGAAVAAPGRRVLSVEADGSAMYTFQSLWTQARESLDVTTVIFDNHSYGILEMELSRVGADAGGPLAKRMLELEPPAIDFVSLARGMGVPATRATSGEDLTEMLSRSFNEPGPSVIVCDVGKGMS